MDDMVISRHKRPAPPTNPAAAPAHPLRRDFQPPAPAEEKRSFWKRMQMPAIIILGIVAGFLVQSAPVGQALIGIYGLTALIFRIESRTTFMLVFLAIATTILMVILQHNSLLGQTFAGYTLLLFCIGVICAAREVRAQKALLSKKRGAERRY
jgi:hypothetical protein